MINKNKKGFTLIEVLISLAIVSVIVGTLFSMINSVIKFNAKNEKDMESIALINTMIEKTTNYIQKTGNIGILGNNGSFEEVIDSGESKITFYIKKTEANEELEFLESDTYVTDIRDFKVEILKLESEIYKDGILKNDNKYLHKIEIIVTPLGISNKIQKVTKEVYGPIE